MVEYIITVIDTFKESEWYSVFPHVYQGSLHFSFRQKRSNRSNNEKSKLLFLTTIFKCGRASHESFLDFLLAFVE